MVIAGHFRPEYLFPGFNRECGVLSMRRNIQFKLSIFFHQAFSLLANHVLSNMKIRKSEQRREALLARLNVEADQLLGDWGLKNKFASFFFSAIQRKRNNKKYT